VEKGEVAIVGGQFLALALVVLILGNYLGTGAINGVSIPEVKNVYWGPPSGSPTLDKGGVTTVKANSSTISVFYSLASGTQISSIAASRLCLNPSAQSKGTDQVYTNMTIEYDSKVRLNYVQLGPAPISTEQPVGIRCYYSITITDSLQQVATWTGTVVVASK
jgi:hypothetical protein